MNQESRMKRESGFRQPGAQLSFFAAPRSPNYFDTSCAFTSTFPLPDDSHRDALRQTRPSPSRASKERASEIFRRSKKVARGASSTASIFRPARRSDSVKYTPRAGRESALCRDREFLASSTTSETGGLEDLFSRSGGGPDLDRRSGRKRPLESSRGNFWSSGASLLRRRSTRSRKLHRISEADSLYGFWSHVPAQFVRRALSLGATLFYGALPRPAFRAWTGKGMA